MINNKFNLPQIVVNALTHDEYTSGGADYSATTLLSPPQMVQLERRHGKRTDTDIVENLWSVFGTAVHNLFETVAEDDALVEHRVHKEFLGKSVSGCADHYKDGVISDFKVTSAWKLTGKDKDLSAWEQQLNIYAELFRMDDREVRELQIIAILRDWSKMQALRNPDYPQAPVIVVSIPLWERSATIDFIEQRVDIHNQNEGEPDDDLWSCSDTERWYTGTKYAIMKGTNKRASKLCDTLEEARQWICSKKGFTIVERPGTNKRCEEYCSVSHVCCQWEGLRNG